MGMYMGCIESRDQITSDSIGPGAPRCGTDLPTHGVRSMVFVLCLLLQRGHLAQDRALLSDLRTAILVHPSRQGCALLFQNVIDYV